MNKKAIMTLLIAGSLLMNGCSAANATGSKNVQVKPEIVAAIKAKEVKDGTNIIIHYYRFENDYKDLVFKAWGGDVAPKAFDVIGEDEFGKVVMVSIAKKLPDLTVGITRNNSQEKETKNNRKILKIEDKVNEVWMIQGDETVYYNRADAVNAPKVFSAIIDDVNMLYVTTTNVLKNEKSFKVKESSGKELSVIDVKKIDDKRFKVFTKEILDVSQKYTVSADGFNGEKSLVGDVLVKDAYYYKGDDLGVTYSKEESKFRVWTPVASEVSVLVFDETPEITFDTNGRVSKIDSKSMVSYPMKKAENGTWFAAVKGDLLNKRYLYSFTINGVKDAVVDPYARGETTNGRTGLIVALPSTNPDGWAKDTRPVVNPYSNTSNYVDYIIWEVHVRDFSISPNSGMKNKGKYLAFAENDTVLTTNPNIKTGVAHLKELGVNALHINPFYDFGSVDESGKNEKAYYNWGYDPYQYNTPEGSYSTNPEDTSRIKEVKLMVQNLHKNGLRAIMDVVYNHTFTKYDSIYDKLVPKYYYRLDSEGEYTNASGCGNEVATEKPMARKFIVDSVKYWVNEYHMDGFRFDLMGIVDRDTMRQVVKELHAIDPTIIIYGEPWYCGDTPLDPKLQINKGDQKGLNIAVFNDNIRDSVKGEVFSATAQGFVQAKKGFETAVKKGVVGTIKYDDKIADFTDSPQETINYVSCHDNLTLWDKLLSSGGKDENLRIRMDKLAQGIIFTSQGIPFMLAGEEMLRTKNKNENSYNSGDKDNLMDWSRKEKYNDVFNYYKGLIELRNKHKAFRMTTADDVRKNLKFYTNEEMQSGEKKLVNVVAFKLNGAAAGDEWKEIVVVYNSNRENTEIKLPDGNNGAEWTVVVDDDEAGVIAVKSSLTESVKNGKFKGEKIVVPPVTMMVMYR